MNKFDMTYNTIDSDSYRFSPNLSLLGFWRVAKDIVGASDEDSILEVGCGPGLTLDFINSTGIEISTKALELTESSVKSKIILGDVLHFEFNQIFKVILDSHTAHCLSGAAELSSYFKKCFDLLEFGGHFLLEIMVRPKNLVLDPGYSYNSDSSTIEKSGVIHRTLLDARQIEDLVLECGLKIVYLRVDGNIKFIPYSHRSESLQTDPDRMRVICLKE